MRTMAVVTVCVGLAGVGRQGALADELEDIARQDSTMSAELTIKMVDELEHEVRKDRREEMLRSVTVNTTDVMERSLSTPFEMPVVKGTAGFPQ